MYLCPHKNNNSGLTGIDGELIIDVSMSGNQDFVP